MKAFIKTNDKSSKIPSGVADLQKTCCKVWIAKKGVKRSEFVVNSSLKSANKLRKAIICPWASTIHIHDKAYSESEVFLKLKITQDYRDMLLYDSSIARRTRVTSG